LVHGDQGEYLISGASIEQVTVDEVTYYQAEPPLHSVLLAERSLATSHQAPGDNALAWHPAFPTPIAQLASHVMPGTSAA
jgi:hypothetical protein